VKRAARGSLKNTGGTKSPKSDHLRSIAQICRAICLQLMHMSTIRKNLLNSSISSTCCHNMLNFGLLTAEIGSLIWGTPANFNGFRVFASLLHRRRSTEANQTLHYVWPSAELVHNIYILGALVQLGNIARYNIHSASMSCALLYWQRYCAALE